MYPNFKSFVLVWHIEEEFNVKRLCVTFHYSPVLSQVYTIQKGFCLTCQYSSLFINSNNDVETT